MSDITQRIKNLPPDKVDTLLKRLRPGFKLKEEPGVPGVARGKRLFRDTEHQNFYLDIERVGELDSLVFKARARDPIDSHLLEIEVQAAGLNLRDIAISHGIYPAPSGEGVPELGCDGAGTVVGVGAAVKDFKIGDEVFFLTNSSSFSRFALAEESLTFLKPPAWSFEDAAGLALVFITAFYSLRIPGRLQAGERILIHSAGGGIGLTATQMASAMGAEVYATAGTPEKRDYLYSLGVKHVMDSRSMSWSDELLVLTNGEGVDVILNSLLGNAIDRGLGILRPDGRFIELGKRDLAPGRLLELAPFLKTLSFTSVDINTTLRLYPQRIRPVIDELRLWLGTGRLQPLYKNVFRASQVVDAFRFMTTGNHIGRIVVAMKGEPILL